MVHHLIVRSLQGRLYLAPIKEDKVQNVLDIGSGTGSRTFQLSTVLTPSLTSSKWPSKSLTGCPVHRYGHLDYKRTWVTSSRGIELTERR